MLCSKVRWMPVYRLQTAIAADTTFPRDYLVMTPHFDDGAIGTDPQNLCDDLAAAINTWTGGGREVKVTAYNAQSPAPSFPLGEKILNQGLSPSASLPREIACCLSFFAGRNLPRQRGRLYVPAFLSGAVNSVRPSAAVRDYVAQLVPIFTGLGGNDVDWSVYSRVDNVARSVTNWWVDDEWDVVRSRGLRPTTRTSGTTSEA